MTSNDLHPVPALAALGAVSGSLGATIVGAGYGDAPSPGAYMVLTGLWFGFVMGFAVWRWGQASLAASTMTVLITWFAWEAAVNLTIQIDRPWPQSIAIATAYKSYLTGLAAGAVGAIITWAGIALNVGALRRSSVAAAVTVTGALFGLLFPAVNYFDSGLVLLLPWQVAVAMMIGFNMPAPQASDGHDRRILAI
ncbi:hypothetical protein HYPDE_33948 [Hyphomicrobium denitrificans 1NES1]|uniref:Uncharacterized protein n=1 Tax=Hyphomicrobium denitrificans 1NES1 TaxID=670307 RepID=N0B8A4_9HYPH|nr:hypothetical protein [Hyphomicrobium denitrificans]AGK58462.1 hypothetical protein HYPDE_33948 [Hyphomicrobium denitrificans 1NES1]